MVLVGCLVLLYFSLRYRNISRESLEILKELKETRSDLQQALQKAGISKRAASLIFKGFSSRICSWSFMWCLLECISASVDEWKRSRRKHWESKWEERDDSLVILHPSSVVSAALSTFSPARDSKHCFKKCWHFNLSRSQSACFTRWPVLRWWCKFVLWKICSSALCNMD